MKFSKTILSTLFLASTTAFANAYNGELGLEYIDNGAALAGTFLPAENVSSLQLYGVYNFGAVDTSDKPLGEADFLGKHSFMSASHSIADPDEGSSVDSQTIGGGFYIPNSMFFIGAQYWKIEDFNDTIVTLGITPVDGLLITTSHHEEADDYNANISAKYVTQLTGDTAVNLEAAYAKGEDAEDEFEEDAEDTLYLAADYYFTSFFSVGATLEDQEESAYGLRTRYFFNDNFSLNAQIVSADEADAYSIGAAFRF